MPRRAYPQSVRLIEPAQSFLPEVETSPAFSDRPEHCETDLSWHEEPPLSLTQRSAIYYGSSHPHTGSV